MDDRPTPMPLGAHLRAASRALHAQQPPADLPTRIRATLARKDAARGAAARPSWAWKSAAAVAFVAAFAWIAAGAFAPAAQVPQPDLAAGFVPVVGGERWREALASGGSAWLVATEMPRWRLAALGLPFDPSRAGDTVQAQLLMHPSGDVLAVRVIHQ